MSVTSLSLSLSKLNDSDDEESKTLPIIQPIIEQKVRKPKDKKRKESTNIIVNNNTTTNKEKEKEKEKDSKEKENVIDDKSIMAQYLVSAIANIESKTPNLNKPYTIEDNKLSLKKLDIKIKEIELNYKNVTNNNNIDNSKLNELFYDLLKKYNESEISSYNWHLKESTSRLERDIALQKDMQTSKKCDMLQNLCRDMEKNHLSNLLDAENLRKKQQDDFSKTVVDISDRLDKHNLNITAREEENQMLRDKIGQFVKLEQVRQEQWANQEKKIELELKIYEEKLKQSVNLITLESQKNQDLKSKLDESMQTNQILATQLSEWQQRFGKLTDSMQQYSDIANQYKVDATKWMTEIKNLTVQKKTIEDGKRQSDGLYLKVLAEKEELKLNYEKLSAQNKTLAGLCRQLKSNADSNESTANV